MAFAANWTIDTVVRFLERQQWLVATVAVE